ncbi:MAG: MerR family DNA-binding transcriptional regulator [Anaerostipes hadrus]
MSKYYSINKFSKILGVSAQTLRNGDKKGKLHPHHTSSNGYRYYSHEQLNQVMNVKPNLDRIVIGYYRVSSNKQKDELERQIENMKLYLTAQGKRANKARKLVKELIDDGGEEDDKNNSSHADPK